MKINIVHNPVNQYLDNYYMDIDGIRVGRCGIIHSGKCNFLCDLEISKDYQGNGLGTHLLKMLINDNMINCLTVDVDNDIAQHLYNKFGFSGDEIITEEKCIDGQYDMYDNFFMSLVDLSYSDKKKLFETIKDICQNLYGYRYSNQYVADDSDVNDCMDVINDSILL